MTKYVLSAVAVAALVFTASAKLANAASSGFDTASPYYTHQTWSFDTNSLTPAADIGFINPNGTTPTAVMNDSNATWYTDGATVGFTGYNGVWRAAGLQNDAVLGTFTIPVKQGGAAEVWVDTILQTNDLTFEDDLKLAVHTGGQEYFAHENVTFAPIGDQQLGIFNVQLRFEGIASITSPLTITMESDLPAGTFVNFDYITVDTISAPVPEPGTVALLAGGALSLLAAPLIRRRLVSRFLAKKSS